MSDELVFHAIVEMIEHLPLGFGGGFRDWIVHTRVQKIISGTLEGTYFAFRVQSPSRSGLALGNRYTVTAIWTGKDYRVDEKSLVLRGLG